MRQPHIDDTVRLTCDLPDLDLTRGQLGVVRSTWCEPLTAYEVEFNVGLTHETRALVMLEQLQIEETGVELASK